MGRRLSLFCCSCLPRKQRDNLSSRALYLDQDSSGHDEYYSDDDNYNYNYNFNDDRMDDENNGRSGGYYSSHSALLTNLKLGQPTTMKNNFSQPKDYYWYHNNNSNSNSNGNRIRSSNDNDNDNDNPPWPSKFTNGHFSRLSTPTGERKSNVFRGFTSSPGHMDESDESDTENINDSSSPSSSCQGFTRPYKDSSSDDDTDHESDVGGVHRNKINKINSNNNRTAIHAQTHFEPYEAQVNNDNNDTTSPGGMSHTRLLTSLAGKRTRPPRNPQGKMVWMHTDDDNDDDDGEQDAKEVIDVDALIAEQERITRELAEQEEALKQEEESAIAAKRLAAIQAAEKRGLLRFDGEQLLVLSSSDNGLPPNDRNSGYSNNGQGAITIQQQPSTKEQMSASAASSYVGGIDSLNQELKMMTFEVSSTTNRVKDRRVLRDGSTTSMSRSRERRQRHSPARTASTPSLVKTPTSITTSTSTSTSTTDPSAMSPLQVLGNITSFFKKADGDMRGEQNNNNNTFSSDDASFSDQEQALSKSSRSNNNTSNSNTNNLNMIVHSRHTHPVAKTKSASAHAPQAILTDHVSAIDATHDINVNKGYYATATATSTSISQGVTSVVIEEESGEQAYPTHLSNNTDATPDKLIDQPYKQNSNTGEQYPTDPYNNPPVVTKANKNEKEEEKNQMASGFKLQDPVQLAQTGGEGPPERIFSTITSLFNTGSTFVGGFFGGGGGGGEGRGGRDGGVHGQHAHGHSDDDSIDDYNF
ncbi:hypothetical protein BGZ94_002745 [Podila epigama]|nr:hypothetical protein BGZ94_002745 [Podila epigama]